MYTNLAKKFNSSSLDWEIFKDNNNITCNYYNFRKNCNKYSLIKIKSFVDENRDHLVCYYNDLLVIYKENSFNDFCKITGYRDSNANLIHGFDRYLINYDLSTRATYLKDKLFKENVIKYTYLDRIFNENSWVDFVKITGYNATKNNLQRHIRKYINTY